MTRVVIIPCGATKRDSACHAGDMYIGAMHRLARRAADVLASADPGAHADIVILSAKHGLLNPMTIIDPYEQQLGKPGAVTPDTVARQAADWGMHDRQVITLLPKRYSQLLTAAGIRIDHDLLAGSRTMGEQRARLATIIRTAGQVNQ